MTAQDPFAGAHLTAQPVHARDEDYARASAEIESRLAELPGTVAVYRTGSISAPGISDIDRIAVTEDRRPARQLWPALSARTRYLAMHTPFLVDRETFVRHRWFAHAEPLALASGSPIEVADRPLPAYSESLIAAEGLVVTMLRLMKQSVTGRVKVRPVLCELNAVRYDLLLGRLSESDAPDAWRLVSDVAELRRRWFEAGVAAENERLLRSCLRRSLPAIAEALQALAPAARALCTGTDGELSLAAPWSNVTLAVADRGRRPPDTGGSAGALLRAVAARSSRTSEARWRARRRRVAVPSAIASLLGGRARPEYAEFHAQRSELVRRYRAFLATSGADYSGIGLASSFVRP